MIYKEFFSILLLVFVGWVFTGSNGTEKIEHGCAPVGWVGNVVASVASLAAPAYAENTSKTFNKVEYGCRYVTWHFFYGSAWEKFKQEHSAPEAAAAASASAATDTPMSPPDANSGAKK